jgi:hypothetical protein
MAAVRRDREIVGHERALCRRQDRGASERRGWSTASEASHGQQTGPEQQYHRDRPQHPQKTPVGALRRRDGLARMARNPFELQLYVLRGLPAVIGILSQRSMDDLI